MKFLSVFICFFFFSLRSVIIVVAFIVSIIRIHSRKKKEMKQKKQVIEKRREMQKKKPSQSQTLVIRIAEAIESSIFIWSSVMADSAYKLQKMHIIVFSTTATII